MKYLLQNDLEKLYLKIFKLKHSFREVTRKKVINVICEIINVNPAANVQYNISSVAIQLPFCFYGSRASKTLKNE